MAPSMAGFAPDAPPTWHAADTDRAIVGMSVDSAVACLRAGRPDMALASFRDLDQIDDIDPLSCATLGFVALAAAAPPVALRWLDRALAIKPDFADAAKGRALALTELGRMPDADLAFEQAFRAGCTDPSAHYNHGNVLAAMGRRDAAIEAYDRALRLEPDYPEALRAGGGILRDSGRHDQALAFWNEALRLRPAYLDAILDRVNLLHKIDRATEALETLDAGLTHLPGDARLLNNRGVVLFHLGRLPEALSCLDLALAADPDLAQAHLHKGEVFVRLGRFDEALDSLDRAVAERPGYVEALCARGVALKLLGRFEESGAALDEALRHDPSSVYTRANKGELNLLLGDYANGWPDYDFRFFTRGHDRPVLSAPVPEWAGEANPGRVVVFADQAAGDVIQFARYLPILRQTGAAVTLVCRPRMQRLLRKASEGIEVIGTMPDHTDFDYQIPLSNMPLACRTTLTTIPDAPYIFAEDTLVERWRERIGKKGFKIGLCWRGSQDWRSDPKRSVPLAHLRKLAEIPGIRLISLQMADNLGPDLESVSAMGIETLGADFDTGSDGFVETVAVMANLDLIVSCDTSIAHLAGAMGRPTFVLLQRVPEWRFLVEREDSPWYPSMRLFRQVDQDQWHHPVARLAEAARGLAAG